jgi:hypothetical protein
LPTIDRSDFVTFVKMEDKRSGRQFVYVIISADKRKTNEIDMVPVVFKHLGSIRPETIYEIYNLDTKTPELEYSEEAKYWI